MAVQSTPVTLGTQASDFRLLDVQLNQQQSLHDLRGEVATVILFICNHCPYVIHIQDQLVQVANTYQPQGIRFVAINSNDVSRYPADAPERMREVARAKAYPFPYLYDETQAVATAYQAACTPDIYVLDADLRCVYHGQFDDARPGNDIPVTGHSLCTALDALCRGDTPDPAQKPSIGCSIKWKE
jgi:peroxiredoxin